MRYASIRSMDISNGEGVGVSLFVQGCHFHCKNCFNKDTWDFNGGKEWTPEIEDKFIELASRPYIKRISLLGGECLADENLDGVLNLVNRIRLLFPEKTIWLYTGYTWEETMSNESALQHKIRLLEEVNKNRDEIIIYNQNKQHKPDVFELRQEIILQCDVLVDGRYIDSQKDITLKWRGSSNQRVIDVQESFVQDRVVLYCD